MTTIQSIIDFHIAENEKNDSYFMDIEIDNEIDYITLLQSNWKKNNLYDETNLAMVHEYVKYCLAKQYQMSKWSNQKHSFENTEWKKNWIEFQGLTLCPITWLLETGLHTIGWIDVNTDEIYSSLSIQKSLQKQSPLVIKNPAVFKNRRYFYFYFEGNKKRCSRHLFFWRSAMGISYNIHLDIYKYDIDHIDPKVYLDEKTGLFVLNDNIKNLQILARKDHSRKTVSDNPQSWKKNLLKNKEKIFQWRDKEMKELVTTFDSFFCAARINNFNTGNFSNAIKNKLKYKGFFWSKDNPENTLCQEGQEKFARQTKKSTLKDPDGIEIKDYQIGNTGIIYMKHGKISIGRLRRGETKGSREITIKGKIYSVYVLVNSTFNGPRKNKTYQTAHKSRDKYISYDETDLEWQSQSENQIEANGKKVKIYDTRTEKVTILDSLAQTSIAYGINKSTLANNLCRQEKYIPRNPKLKHLVFEKLEKNGNEM